MVDVKENLETINQKIPTAVSTMTLRKLVSTTPHIKKLKNISNTWVSLKEENNKKGVVSSFLKRYLKYAFVSTVVFVSAGIFLKNNSKIEESLDRYPAAIEDSSISIFSKSFEKLNNHPDEKLLQQLELLEDNYKKFKEMGLEAGYIDKITIKRVNSLIEKDEFSKAKKVTVRANLFLLRKIKNERDKNE